MRILQTRAQLADIEAQLAEMQVIAPADSTLEVLSVKVGDVLPPNGEVATLLLTKHLWVRVYVPETWLGFIKLGDHVRVQVDSFPHTDFPGTVEQVNRQAEFTPRNVQIWTAGAPVVIPSAWASPLYVGKKPGRFAGAMFDTIQLEISPSSVPFRLQLSEPAPAKF